MYEVITEENDKVLYKVKKDGSYIEQCRTVKTADGSILMLPKHKKDILIFKSLSDIKLLLVGNQYISKVTEEVQVYIKPHYQELHHVIMTESYNRYSLAAAKYRQHLEIDNIELDDTAILDNMLEYVGRI